MSAPKPASVSALCDDLRRLADRIEREYEELYPSAYEARRSGRGGGRSYGVRDVSSVLVGSLSNDPRNDARAGGTEDVRRLLSDTGRHVARAAAEAKGAAKMLGRVADVIDKGADRTITDPAIVKSLGSWKDNHADGEQARLRRLARGAVLPGSDYPVTRSA